MMAMTLISLFKLIGIASLVGVGVLCLSIVVELIMTRFIRNLDKKKKKIEDKRLEITNQVFQNMKAVKLAAWT